MKKFVTFLMLLLLSGVMSAQRKNSVVYMNDGSVKEGRILSRDSGQLVLRYKKKKVDTVSVEDVSKILPWSEAESAAPVNMVTLNLKLAVSLAYERRMFNRKTSLGTDFLFTTSQNYAGVELRPKYRYYIYGEAASYGFYVQAMPVVGCWWLTDKTIDTWLNPETGPRPSSYKILNRTFVTAGGSVSVGYLWNLGEHWGIDLRWGAMMRTSDGSRVQFVRQKEYNNPEEGSEIVVMSMNDYYKSQGWVNGFWSGGASVILEGSLGVVYRF